jgi:4'-phosphopantetheinyl transferase
MCEIIWAPRPGRPTLQAGEVHLLRFPLSGADTDSLDLRGLNEEEKRRARRFKRPLHQQRFANGRRALRDILATYTEESASSIEFSYGEHGKPTLAGDAAKTGLHFNLSHTGDEALCAVSNGRHVGVDIEFHKERVETLKIAARFFSAEESAYLAARRGVDRTRAFYQFWTAKEALLKGEGGGLTLPLDRCRFTLGEVPLGLVVEDLPAVAESDWRVYPLSVGPEHSAAVAVADGDPAEISFSCWI